MKNKKIYPWVVVGLLWVVALLNYMDRQMLSTMQEAMKVDIVELNKAEAFGALMAVFLWIYGFMSPVAGVSHIGILCVPTPIHVSALTGVCLPILHLISIPARPLFRAS